MSILFPALSLISPRVTLPPEAFHALFPVSVSLKAGVFYRLGSHNTPINVMPAAGGGGPGHGVGI